MTRHNRTTAGLGAAALCAPHRRFPSHVDWSRTATRHVDQPHLPQQRLHLADAQLAALPHLRLHVSQLGNRLEAGQEEGRPAGHTRRVTSLHC